MLTYIKQLIKKPKETGTICASSPLLINSVLKNVNFSKDQFIIELGAGDGCFTKEIIKNMSANSQLIIFEINESYKKELEKIIGNDQRVKLIFDSAENMEKYCEGKQPNVIVSTVPLTMLDNKIVKNILLEVKKNLQIGGLFLQIQYSLIAKKLIETHLGEIKLGFELLNIPPSFIYIYEKPAE
ncbi:MAG TPA: rRNA adenine N-6-methyltransferase family protein [Candidatus Absconditabacterales bacterium]|nr:rRNA adenine N-6-methyltransferase family protein [Candidatus Absconditabacterales bacterium]HMT27069.1 rRNA adenine N-6-methyltransferase family protein [Candidatus Absconditabacterales bacterium]